MKRAGSLVLAMLSIGPLTQGADFPTAQALKENERIEATLAGNETRIYQIVLRAGQLASLSIERRGLDPIVEVFNSHDERLAEFPDEGTFTGPLTVKLAPKAGGTYKLHIRARFLSDAARAFTVRLNSLTNAADADAARFDALIFSTESEADTHAGRYDDALSLAERAVATAESGSPRQDAFLAELYRRLGVAEYNKAKRGPAQAALEQALSIERTVLGEGDPLSARTLIALARLYEAYADVPKAEDALRQARALIEKSWGADHPWQAECLQMTSKAHQHRGDTERALADIRAALVIDRAYPTADERRLILDLDALADTYLDRHDADSAKQTLEEILQIEDRHSNQDQVVVAHTLQNLGIIARRRKQYQEALDDFWRAEKIREQIYGPVHPSTVSLLVNLGNVYHAQGDDVRAEEVFQQAISRFTESLGPYHEWTIMTLGNLTKSYAAQSNIPAALEALKRTNEASEEALSLNLAIGSEHDRLSYADKFSSLTDRTISLNISQAPNDALATELAAEVILQRKGRVLDALANTMAALRAHLQPEDRALLDDLSAVTSEFAKVALHGAGELSHEEHRKQLDALQRRREALETSLSERSAGFYQNPQSVTLRAVRAMVPKDAALLEFAVYRPFDVHGVDASDTPSRYAVYLIPTNGDLEVRDLGPAKDLDTLVEKFREALRDPSADPTPEARQLYAKVLQPLQGLGESTRLLISPDGALNLVPFEALMDEKNRYLLAQREISYLSSGRDLLRFGDTRAKASRPAILADPDFGDPAAGRGKTTSRGIDARRSVTNAQDLRTVYFAALSGTAREARDLKVLFPDADLLTKDSASKANLKNLAAPRLLHIATHGFFLDHEARAHAAATDDPRGIQGASSIENPLLRSGLALAGANLNKDDSEEGILTALEAANLNLWGTKLVTLSACDTGVGEIRQGEGVFGLRRAFVLAGAETLVMSLWPVSDAVTRQLMDEYYRGLKQGLGRGAALHRAQIAMMTRASRAHPFYWASFIQAGDWANLDGVR